MRGYLHIFHRLRAALQPLYDAGEAAAIAKRYLEEVTGMNYASALAQREESLPPHMLARIEQDIPPLAEGRPLQYVIGHETFWGREFSVNEAVLIPRPETELLVKWVAEECSDANTILDVGTGSGCIAVSLALALPDAEVFAMDVSGEALTVAKQNAEALGARVSFIEMDALDIETWRAMSLPHDDSGNRAINALPLQMDVIVSNPPYIPAAEGESLHQNVRDWEPHSALFVPDNDPLIFYRALAEAGEANLGPGGRIFCELQTDRAEETKALFESYGYKAELRKDDFGMWRMVRASRA